MRLQIITLITCATECSSAEEESWERRLPKNASVFWGSYKFYRRTAATALFPLKICPNVSFFSNFENQPEMISKEFSFAISISISSRKIHAYMMHIQKLVFHCISCFANCWLTQLYEGRRSSWRCLSKLRWNWNTNAMHCKKRTLTSSGKCAVLHSQFRLIGDQLSDLKIGAWKLNDKICRYLTLFEFLHKI